MNSNNDDFKNKLFNKLSVPKKITLLFMLMLMIAVITYVPMTLTKYVASINKSATTQVARWHVLCNDIEMRRRTDICYSNI